MSKRILLLMMIVSLMVFTNGCQSSNKTEPKGFEIYNPDDYFDYNVYIGIDMETLPIQLKDEKEYNKIQSSYKKAIIVSQYDRDEAGLLVSYFNKKGDLLWEKNINRDPQTFPTMVYYFKTGIALSYREDQTDYTVKYDFKGNEVWKMEGTFTYVYGEAGFFTIFKDKADFYALYLDTNGEIIYKHGPFQQINRIASYDDQSTLYVYKKLNEPYHYVKTNKEGKTLFDIENQNSQVWFDEENEEFYLYNLPTYSPTFSVTIDKYDRHGKKLYNRLGQYRINNVKDDNLYLLEIVDSKEHFVKIDDSGNKVFKTESYESIDMVDYLNDGNTVLYTTNRTKNQLTVVKLNADGEVIKTAGPYDYQGAYGYGTRVLKRTNPKNDDLIIMIADGRNDQITNANVIKLDRDLNEVSNQSFERLWLHQKAIFYKDNGQFGVLSISQDGNITKNQLETFDEHTELKEIKIVNHKYIKYYTILYYNLMNTYDGSSIHRLIKLNNNEFRWKMDIDALPSQVYESEYDNVLIHYNGEQSNFFQIYDSKFNKIQEVQLNKNIKVFFDDEHILYNNFDVERSIKLFDYHMNLVTEGKIIDSQNMFDGRYYIKDPHNNIIQMTININ